MDSNETVRFHIAGIQKTVAAIRLADSVRQSRATEPMRLRWRLGQILIVLGRLIAGPPPCTHSHVTQ